MLVINFAGSRMIVCVWLRSCQEKPTCRHFLSRVRASGYTPHVGAQVAARMGFKLTCIVLLTCARTRVSMSVCGGRHAELSSYVFVCLPARARHGCGFLRPRAHVNLSITTCMDLLVCTRAHLPYIVCVYAPVDVSAHVCVSLRVALLAEVDVCMHA